MMREWQEEKEKDWGTQSRMTRIPEQKDRSKQMEGQERILQWMFHLVKAMCINMISPFDLPQELGWLNQLPPIPWVKTGIF